MPLVAMNELALVPVPELSAPLNVSANESNGVSTPRTSKMFSSPNPAPLLSR
jgi:hypothetical protein